MSESFLSSVLQTLPLLVIVGVIVLARRNRKRVVDWGAVGQNVALQPEAGGERVGDTPVPVSQLMRRTRWSSTHNGMTPKLWLTPTGLRFKIFKPAERRFDEFQWVDARKDLFYGTRLIFAGDGEWLHVLMRQRGAARALLQRLPPQVPLTPSAVALRDAR